MTLTFLPPSPLSSYLAVYTPLAFISCYVACGVCHIGDTCSEYNIPHTHNEQAATSEAVSLSALDARIAEDCYSLASIALLEMSLKPFKASDTAAAIIYYVRRCLKVQPVWSTRLSELTQTDPERDGFKAVYRVLADIFSASADKNTTSNTSAAAETTSTSHSDRESERERESSESEGPDPNTLLTPIKGANAPDSSNTKTNTNTNISANTIANTNIMTTPQTIRGPLSTCDGHDGTDGIRQALSCSTLSEGRDQHHRPIPLDDPTQPHGVYCTPTDDKDKDKENSCRLFLGPSPGSVAAMDSLEGV